MYLDKQKLKEKIYEFIMNELPHKDSTNFHKFPYLIPLAYQLMKKILTSCTDKQEKDKLLKDVAQKAGESVKIIVEQQSHAGERRSVSSNNIFHHRTRTRKPIMENLPPRRSIITAKQHEQEQKD